MCFEVDIEGLIKANININDYLLCQFIAHNDIDGFNSYIEKFGKFFTKDTIIELIDKKLLYLEESDKGFRFSNIKVSNLFIDTFIDKEVLVKKLKSSITNKNNFNEIDEWFDEWYSLWPRGIKVGGYPVKGDRKGCLKRLEKFTKEYPEYSKEVILKATKDYIDLCRINRYNYMKLAHYFIYKDNVSTLASYCEAIEEKVKNGEYDLDDNFNYDNISDI